MAKIATPPSDTRTRILDAAESLIAGNGFRNVSLRQITGEANVNIAAVNYHFGSREGLIGQVLARVIRPINQQRLHLLDLPDVRLWTSCRTGRTESQERQVVHHASLVGGQLAGNSLQEEGNLGRHADAQPSNGNDNSW